MTYEIIGLNGELRRVTAVDQPPYYLPGSFAAIPVYAQVSSWKGSSVVELRQVTGGLGQEF